MPPLLLKGPSPLFCRAWPVVNDLLTLPVAAEQSAPGLDADSVLGACEDNGLLP